MGSGVAFAALVVFGGLALLLPARSPTQYAAIGVAVLAGIAAWFGFPAWTLLLRRVLRTPVEGSSQRQE
ncbi:MAG: hypothetical protein L0I24_21510 [Pseudonocardia sp.]|nr:hypothetical protein [Pseudonocardia sp.]